MEGDYFYGDRFVTQHDLLRELAIYNAKQDPVEQRQRIIVEVFGNNIPKWWKEQKHQPTKARLLSITTDKSVKMTWPQIQLPEAEVLVLNLQEYEFTIPEFVEKMEKLKVVVIVGDGAGMSTNIELLELLPNLKRISLDYIPINSLTKNHMQLKSLKKISLKSCNTHPQLSKGVCKLSDAFPNLEEVNIDNCYQPEELLADFCNLINLKRISVYNCKDLRSLPEEIGNLVNLEVLRLRCGDWWETFPVSVGNLKKLNFLDLSQSSARLPYDIGELSSLRKLDMRSCNVEYYSTQNDYSEYHLPHSVVNLDQLEEVICDEEVACLWKYLQRRRLTNLRIVAIPSS